MASEFKPAAEARGGAEIRLAYGFDDAIHKTFPFGEVSASTVAGGCALLVVGYLAQLPPAERALILNDFVETVLAGLNDEIDTDAHLDETDGRCSCDADAFGPAGKSAVVYN